MKYKLKDIATKVEINLKTGNTEIHLKDKFKFKINKIIQADLRFNLDSFKKCCFYLYDNNGSYIRDLKEIL